MRRMGVQNSDHSCMVGGNGCSVRPLAAHLTRRQHSDCQVLLIPATSEAATSSSYLPAYDQSIKHASSRIAFPTYLLTREQRF